VSKAETTREEILVAAARALQTYGFKATTFDNIATDLATAAAPSCGTSEARANS